MPPEMPPELLEHKSVLLLQGPAGPFMKRFAHDLRGHGLRVTKVNFNAQEVLYYRDHEAVAFREHFEYWPKFLRALIHERSIGAIFLFGDCRPLHRQAIAIAHELGLRVWVFEEGYLRPDWITLEEDGVNGFSKMPRDPDFFRSLDLPPLPAAIPPGDSAPIMSWWSTIGALTFTHLNSGFPHYKHHRELNAWYHTILWIIDFFRKRFVRFAQRKWPERVEHELDHKYFFVPLQTQGDFQFLHSPYDLNEDFIDDVLRSFADHADPGVKIIFKHHPLDRPYNDYARVLRETADKYGVRDRLVYVHDVHLPTLLRHAIGTITVNSTTGLQSIYHGAPVKVMGTAIYDMPGLTFQGTLAEFWKRQDKPDMELFEAFRRYLLYANQINGNFYKRLPGHKEGIGAIWFPGYPPRTPKSEATSKARSGKGSAATKRAGSKRKKSSKKTRAQS